MLKKKNRGMFKMSSYRKPLLKTGLFVKNKFVKNIEKKRFEDTNDLKKSIFVKPKNNTVLIGSGRPQARIGEYGRKPGTRPNFNGLVGRTIRKLGWSGTKTGSYDNQPTDTKSKVFLVARKIKNKGIKARNIFSTAVNEQEITTFLIREMKGTI